jgi:catechol 2,3-dioxygenase-like lactoylglutathione lyase family enzyme
LIDAVDHINLVVSDLERSVRFYTEVLGFKEIRRAHLEGEWIESIIGLKDVRANVVYIVAPEGEPRLELLCYESPAGKPCPAHSLANTPGLRHIALRVKNIQEAVKRLQQAQVQIIGDTVAVPSSAVTHEAGQKVLCYFLDPDGILLELAEYR